MKVAMKITLMLLLTVFFDQYIYSQEAVVAANSKQKRHSINIEALGRTFIFGSVNYEYTLHKKLSIGAGFSILSASRSSTVRANNGFEESGIFSSLVSTQMIYGNYFVGKGKHKLLLTAGATGLLSNARSKFPSETLKSHSLSFHGNMGIGYNYLGDNVYYRLTVYCLQLPDLAGWFPRLMPWIGTSVGFRF